MPSDEPFCPDDDTATGSEKSHSPVEQVSSKKPRRARQTARRIMDFRGFPRAAVDTPSDYAKEVQKQHELQTQNRALRYTRSTEAKRKREEEEVQRLPREIRELDSKPNPLNHGLTQRDPEFGFQYLPLPSEPKTIRIVVLLPGAPTDQLECVLQHTAVESAEPYQAISYVWGAKEDTASIRCHGGSLRIPRNLYDAFLELRCRSKPKRIWADAICINQGCDHEKSHQIPLMRVIFGQAEKVLVWLGCQETNLAERVFGFARRVSGNDFEALIKDEGIWHECSMLFSQDWFWRVWCFQEIVLARKAEVMWGKAIIDWNPLGRTAAWIAGTGYEVIQKFPLPGVHNASLMHSMSCGVTNSEPRSFLRLLMLTRQFECTKSEDRIYGLLGIKTADTDPEHDVFFMKPSYGTTKEAVYEEFAVKVIEASQDMTLLSAVQHGPHLSAETKSWVPQWDKNYTRSIASADYLAIGFSASLHLQKVPPSFHNSHLVVHGLEVDTVESMTAMMPEKDSLCSEQWKIQDLWTKMVAPLESYPNDSDLATAFAWTLTAGKDWMGNSVQDEVSHLADFAAFAQQNFDPEITEFLEISDVLTRGSNDGKGDAGRYTEAMYGCFCLRRFFVTRKGYIGIGPACMQEGDKVCVLSGAIVPFIIRPDGLKHRLIGEAYVHGNIHGEACEWPESGSLELSAFCFS